MEKTTQDILNEAAILLQEEGRWTKGRLFAKNTSGDDAKGCSMCAHGAIAYCGDRAIRDLIEENKLGEADQKATNVMNGVIRLDIGGDINVQKQSVYTAHMNAKKVGLTFSYNDAVERTKGEVVAKLHEAAQL